MQQWEYLPARKVLQRMKPYTNYADCFNVFSRCHKAGANRHSFVHRWLLGLWHCNNWVQVIFLMMLFWGMNFVFVSHTLFTKVSSQCVSLCPPPLFTAQLFCCGSAEFREVSQQPVPQHLTEPQLVWADFSFSASLLFCLLCFPLTEYRFTSLINTCTFTLIFHSLYMQQTFTS